ncbi:hypothetical protein CHLRE_06g284300v5 [Chlamydomonas reinhardtii]|uniref:Uncharacterized protein n=1 Tax=Chlamydomonas reinhardtii TaxID=3055 RepID=A0A2K3DPZ9_CHLRE|nr:uncharacterized protein CHLRE_06g284300v5 [Chlamydomonas reinhardtii]PNW82568.1 hypothetical protein CHLRE_06g284300v5 [Chlamydomonas reinhardtii]
MVSGAHPWTLVTFLQYVLSSDISFSSKTTAAAEPQMDYDALYRRRDAAARRIQAAWRAHRGRKAFLKIRNAAQRIQTMAKGWYVRKKVAEQRGRQEMEQRFHTVMDKHREKIRILEAEKRALLALPGAELEEWERRRFLAAVRVQAAWRGLVARRKMAKSPERARREQAALKIQAAFKRILHSKRASGALASAVAAAGNPLTTATAAAAAQRQSYLMRQSGASVLLGSPRLQGSPESARGGGGLSPQQQAAAGVTGLAAAAAAEGAVGRGSSVMGPRRYKELKAQVDGKLAAHVALAKARGAAKRPDPGIADARLAELLRDYHTSAPARLADAHTRQRNLVVVDTLCVQLEQMRPLKELPPDVAPQDFPRPPRGTERAERAAQAHALSLTDARVGKWWTHLRSLNTQAVQESLLAEDEERWEAMDARWRRMWQELEEQENRRPDTVDQYKPRTGVGAAAVAAARQAAAMLSKEEEYARRSAAAALAVPEAPLPGTDGGRTSGRAALAEAARQEAMAAAAARRSQAAGAGGGGGPAGPMAGQL